MKKRNAGYYFKLCNINGVHYAQIWEKSAERAGAGYYVRSCGTAEELMKKLDRLKEIDGEEKNE